MARTPKTSNPSDEREAKRRAVSELRRKKQERYWHDRAQSRVRANDRGADAVKAEHERAYKAARASVLADIDKFYRDFGMAAGISPEEARQRLSRRELKGFQDELERKRGIIREMIAKDPQNKAIRVYDEEFKRLSKVRELTRKEALESNISAEIVALGCRQQRSIQGHSGNAIQTSLKMNAEDLSQIGIETAKLGIGNPEQVHRSARENWQHGDFSDRIWDDKARLIHEAREIIENGFAHHAGAMDMATDLMTRMNVSHSNALRLVRTEFNHLSNQAALAEYKANGIKKYKFVAAIDNRTCNVCHELNGKEFYVSEAKTGVNFPPIHPNCRSVTVPVIDWGDEDAWDYSHIELDDDELKSLGLTDADVRKLDETAPRPPANAAAPSLTVQQANQAAEDTKSVIRREELAWAVKQQGESIEAKARSLNDDVSNISDEIGRHENWNARLYKDSPIAIPQAAIEAENLERIKLDIERKELELRKLEIRAAKLDNTYPKPAHADEDKLKKEIEAAKVAREKRRKNDLDDSEIIAKATPSPFDLPQQAASDAIAPRTAFGKPVAKAMDAISKLKERFNDWLNDFINRAKERWDDFTDWFGDALAHDTAFAMDGGGRWTSRGVFMSTGAKGNGTGRTKETKPPYQPTPEEQKHIDRITAMIEKANESRGGEPIIGKQQLLDENKDIITEKPKPGSLTTAQSIARKLVTYSLNPNQKSGKSRVFRSALNVTIDAPGFLISYIVFDPSIATKTSRDQFGQRFRQKNEIDSPYGKKVTLITGWLLQNDGVLHLTTAFID